MQRQGAARSLASPAAGSWSYNDLALVRRRPAPALTLGGGACAHQSPRCGFAWLRAHAPSLSGGMRHSSGRSRLCTSPSTRHSVRVGAGALTLHCNEQRTLGAPAHRAPAHRNAPCPHARSCTLAPSPLHRTSRHGSAPSGAECVRTLLLALVHTLVPRARTTRLVVHDRVRSSRTHVYTHSQLALPPRTRAQLPLSMRSEYTALCQSHQSGRAQA